MGLDLLVPVDIQGVPVVVSCGLVLYKIGHNDMSMDSSGPTVEVDGEGYSCPVNMGSLLGSGKSSGYIPRGVGWYGAKTYSYGNLRV